MGNTYRKFCLNRCLNTSDSLLTIDLGGYPLIHPYYIIVYKSKSEEKWFSEFDKNDVYSMNQEVLESLGLVDPWGKRQGLKVWMRDMKNRNNDGRLRGYENLAELPDEIIPSGHYLCYMRKMCNKFYSDTMWYSLHDIDGTIIQSNMFNTGITQIYTFLGVDYTLNELISKAKSLVFSEGFSKYIMKKSEYIEEIDQNIKLNSQISYVNSEVRAKPCEINTYYNKWWQNKCRESSTMALIKVCPWMALLKSSVIEYIDCLKSSENVEIQDIMNVISEEEPLMKLMVTTRSESRIMDRFDTISSWIFYNSLPGMHPVKIKKTRHSYSLPKKDHHPECISAILFETVSSGRINNPNDLKILTNNSDGSFNVDRAMNWLSNKVSNDPIFMMVNGKGVSSWINTIDFISIKNNQYSQFGRYWIGKTQCICRISSRSYCIVVTSGKIVEIRCSDQYGIKNIIEDMKTVDSFGFCFESNISPYKTKNIMRLTKTPDGKWIWTDGLQGMPYYSEIKLDPSIVTNDKLIYESDTKSENSIRWSKFKLKYKEGKNKYRAYILHNRPCKDCIESCEYCGSKLVEGEGNKCSVKLTKKELIERFVQSQSYKMLYDEYLTYGELFKDSAYFMGQVGTTLSAFYEGSAKLDDQNYFVDYRGEFFLQSLAENTISEEIVENVKSNLSKYIKISLNSGMIVTKANSQRVKEMVAEYGAPTVSAALVLLPVKRTKDYYSPMTMDDYWYNNQQILPDFMTDMIKYISSTLSRQRGTMFEKRRTLEMIIDEIVDYLSITYHLLQSRDYQSDAPYDLKLSALLKRFEDVGETDDESVSNRFFYDECSIMGCMIGWLRFIMVYSARRNGVLIPGYKTIYKQNYNSFLKKFRSFSVECLGYTPKLTPITELNIFRCAPYQMDYNEADLDDEEMSRVYPLRGCNPLDFTQEEEDYDDEYMTHDREESIISFGYNQKMNYDYSNESVFLNEGDKKMIRICDQSEADNWEINRDTLVSRLKRGKSKNSIYSSQYHFTRKPSRIQPIGGINNEDLFKENEKTLMDVIYEQMTPNERRMIRETNPIFKENSRYNVKTNVIMSALAKHSILQSVFDKDGDLTSIIESKNYDNIINQSIQLNNTCFNQLANAEEELLVPGYSQMTQTNSWRLTRTSMRYIRDKFNSTIFKNQAIKFNVERMIASATITEHTDMMVEKTSQCIYQLIEDTGYIQTAIKDDQLPHPEENTIPYTSIIGV